MKYILLTLLLLSSLSLFSESRDFDKITSVTTYLDVDDGATAWVIIKVNTGEEFVFINDGSIYFKSMYQLALSAYIAEKPINVWDLGRSTNDQTIDCDYRRYAHRITQITLK